MDDGDEKGWTRDRRARAEAKLAAVAATTNLGDDAREDESALSAEALAARVEACAMRIERAVADVREAQFVDAAVEAVRAAVEARRGERRVTTLVLGLGSPATAAKRQGVNWRSRRF